MLDGIDELSEDIAAQKNALRSQLQVLDDDEDLLNEEDTFPNVQVRVLSPQDLIGGTHTLFGLGSERKPPFIKRGKIVLDVGEKRPLVQRREVTTYRLTCEHGKMYAWQDVRMVRCKHGTWQMFQISMTRVRCKMSDW